MRIQCDQCSAKYAIADDKIRGESRVFKIRCKSCSSIITIHGVADGNADTVDEGAAPVWYYVLNGEQVGPVNELALSAALVDGVISEESFVWKAGMSDWLPMTSVDELDEVISGDTAEEITDVPDAVLDDLAAEAEQARGADPDEEPLDEAEPEPEPEPEPELDVDRTIEAPSPWAFGDAADPEAALAAATAAAGLSAPEAEPEAPVVDPDPTVSDGDLPDEPEPQAEAEPDPEPGAEAEPDPEPEPEPEPEPAIEAPVLDTDATLSDLFHSGEEPQESSDMFDSLRDDEPTPEQDDLDSLGADPGATGENKLVWQRHDNSVLFSLSEVDEKKKEEEDPAKETAKAAALAAITADSGLIDIRSFAKKKEKKKNADLFGDLAGDSPLPGPMPSADVDQLHSPAMVPVIQRKKRRSAVLILGAIAGAAAVAGLTAFLVMKYMVPAEAPRTQSADAAKQQPVVVRAPAVVEKAKPADPKAAARPAAEKPAEKPTKIVKTSQRGGPQKPVEKTSEPGAAARKPDAEGAAKPAEPAEARAAPVVAEAAAAKPKKPKKPLTPAQKAKMKELRERKRQERAAKAAAAAKAKAERPRPASKPSTPSVAKAPAKPKSDANDLLAGVMTRKADAPKPKAAAPGPTGDLPNAPTNVQVKRVMRKAAAPVRRCVTNSGQSNVHVATSFQITPGGGVSGVRVKGPVASTAAAGCVKSAIQALKFPASRQGKRVNYPFFVK